MAISVTDLGHNGNNTGATVALTSLSVPAHVLVAVGTVDGSNATSGGSCTDSSSNSYTSIIAKAFNNTSANGFGQIFNFNNNAASLTSITYTKVTSGSISSITAFYATGILSASATDSAVTNSATGSSSAPSVTSGTPAVAGELFAALIGSKNAFTTLTNAGSWTTPFDTDTTNSAAAVYGGHQVNAGTGTIAYTPTVTGGTQSWAALVVGFKPAIGAVEINVIGRHTPTAFRRFGGNVWDTGVPQPETNPHTIGRHTPVQLRGLAAYRQTYPTADVVYETNIHTLGRFVATTLNNLLLLRQNTNDQAPETNPHTPGHYTPPVTKVLPPLRQNPALDQAPETNVHFVGHYQVAFHRILPALRQNYPPADTQAETNIHTLGRYSAPILARFNYNSLDTTIPTPVQPETNLHTLGRFAAVQLRQLPLLRQNYPGADTQPETNVHFQGRFTPTRLSYLTLYRLNPALDLPPQPETNVHMLGRFQAPINRIAVALRQNYPTADFVVETNPHVIGRFVPMRIVTLALYRQASALDLPPVQPETNINTLGRFSPPRHAINPSLRQNVPFTGSATQPETNVSMLGRFTSPTYRILAQHRQNYPGTDTVRETNIHTLGRFSVRAHFISPELRQNEARDVPPERVAEPHMLGRFTPTRFLTLPGHRQNIPSDILVLEVFGIAFARDFAVWTAADEDIPAALAMPADAPVWSAPPEDVTTEPAAACGVTDSALWTVAASSIGSDRINPMGPYQIQSTIELEGAFTGQNGQNTDPTTVTLLLEDPDGNETTYQWPGGPVVRTGVGFFTFEFVATISGTWTYKWQGTGAVVATSADTTFEVLPSALIPG